MTDTNLMSVTSPTYNTRTVYSVTSNLVTCVLSTGPTDGP